MVNPVTCSGGRRRTKKHKRHSRRRMRGGTTEASFSGVETLPGGNIDVRTGVNMSGTEFTRPGYGGGRRRRSRKTRRRHRRMRGGDASTTTGGEGHGGMSASFTGNSIGANAPGAAVYAGTSTRVV
jgi:hypothetical protein